MSIATYKLLGCRGYARVDLRLDARGYPNILEVNPNPDIAIPSWSEEGSGLLYHQIVERIVKLAFDGE